VSGFLRLADNPPPLPDEGGGISSGTAIARRVVYLEPDDNKPLTYTRYSGYRRVRRVRRYERGYTGEGGRMDYRKWCSGGARGMVRAQDGEDSGFFRCS
jgi:hypothetical protein